MLCMLSLIMKYRTFIPNLTLDVFALLLDKSLDNTLDHNAIIETTLIIMLVDFSICYITYSYVKLTFDTSMPTIAS